MRFGVNMFGLNAKFSENKEEFLKRIKRAGYRFMEPCFMPDEVPELKRFAWTEKDFDENMPLLEKYGIKIEAIHAFTTAIHDDVKRLIPFAKKYDIKYVVIGCPKIEKGAYADYISNLKMAADLFANEGIKLVLHNAKEGSIERIEGISVYEWFLNNAGENLYAEPDLGWLLYGGVDPEEFLWRHKDKIVLLHYKDMKKADGQYSEAEIGCGDVDNIAAFQFARAIEIVQYMDQDNFDGNPLDVCDRVGNRFNMWKNARDNSDSILCVMDTDTGEVTELRTFKDRVIEAPNWYQQDDDYLFYNAEGYIYKYQISTGTETRLESGMCNNCNNDHVIKADGTEIAVSHSVEGWQSQVYIIPIEGGEPRLITKNAPSYLHGWSPDGNELAYCAFRGGWENLAVDIFAISADGGEEWQLTKNAGFNDGPEYSPTGEEILFISTRTGLMQNWKMKRDGSEQTQMTFSEKNNWFGHYSPDGKKIVYLSYSKDGLDPNEHLPNMFCELSLMNSDGSDEHVILKFFGGQGSINVNSWNPDSKRFAFVKYDLKHK